MSPASTSIPTSIANAMYGMSDHLPVIMKLYYDSSTTSIKNLTEGSVKFNNPVDDYLIIEALNGPRITRISVYSLMGNLVFSRLVKESDPTSFFISTNNLISGIYILNIQYNNGQKQSFKFVKK
jgi:hypothetical protein